MSRWQFGVRAVGHAFLFLSTFTMPGAFVHSLSLAVFPTVGLFGPLALLAMLFPAVFGGLALWFRRWVVLLGVASVDSTLYLLHAWFWPTLHGHATEAVLWAVMAIVALGGALYSWIRFRRSVRLGAADAASPRKSDLVVLVILGLAGLAATAWAILKQRLTHSPWLEMLPIWIAAWAGVVYLAGSAATRRSHRAGFLHLEGFILLAVSAACGSLGLLNPAFAPGFATQDARPARSGLPHIRWQFWPRQRGLIASSPVVVGDRVYAAALVFDGASQQGTLYCVDTATGHELWRFNDEGAMKPVFCTPCIASGRLYIGEGFHQDADCKMYCLDANTGVKQWEFLTASHTEASPCVVDGRLYFGAGDDGVYCLDAATGQTRWHFPGRHVDMKVAVAGGRVYAGSGYGTLDMFCLDSRTGRPLWHTPSPLPVFAAPVATGDRVFFGVGNGDLDESAPRPAGALMCLNAATGAVVWRHPVADGIHVQPVVTANCVYCAARDGRCYCLDRQTGNRVWQTDLGSPLVTAPRLAGANLYVLASAGRVCCLNAASGETQWSLDVTGVLRSDVRLRSSPCLTVQHDQQRLYFGADATNILNSEPVLLCLEDDVSTPQ